jgi:hypothetical protein
VGCPGVRHQGIEVIDQQRNIRVLDGPGSFRCRFRSSEWRSTHANSHKPCSGVQIMAAGAFSLAIKGRDIHKHPRDVAQGFMDSAVERARCAGCSLMVTEYAQLASSAEQVRAMLVHGRNLLHCACVN